MGTVGARIEAPKAPKGVGSGEGVSSFPLREGSGEGAVPLPRLPRKNFDFGFSNRRILVQTGCFLRSSPKAGLKMPY